MLQQFDVSRGNVAHRENKSQNKSPIFATAQLPSFYLDFLYFQVCNRKVCCKSGVQCIKQLDEIAYDDDMNICFIPINMIQILLRPFRK